MTSILTRNQLLRWGLTSRTRRHGPEKDLVDWFLAHMPIKVHESYRLTIFEEPKIESGFPDLVLVIWDEEQTRAWNASRARLNATDFKILHCIFQKRRVSASSLEITLSQSVDRAIDRLAEAGLIIRDRKAWKVRPLNEIFAVKRIIAVEAKISDVSAGMDQAVLNTWFAHDSFLLVPQPLRTNALIERAAQLDVGVFAQKSNTVIKPNLRPTSPRSYASWLFNEWAWKAHHHAIA
jgi:hypothetical protein